MSIVDRVRSVIGPGPAALHEPDIGPREREAVWHCLESGWVSYAGPAVREFEAALARRCMRKHCIATSSGTAALKLALLGVGVKPGDWVSVPNLTFVATANAVVHAGARVTFDEAPVQIVVDLFGSCAAHRVPWEGTVIEDASQALGSELDGRPAGSFGRVSTLSFNGNKIVTAGGGGAVLTNDDGIAEYVRHIASTAKVHEGYHDQVGFNDRMPALNAALGLAQLERLDEFLAKKRKLHEAYAKVFDGLECGEIWHEDDDDGRSNHWLNVLFVPRELREAMLAELHAAGYQARACWTPLHLLPMYRDAPIQPHMRDVAELCVASWICLPSSPKLWRDA